MESVVKSAGSPKTHDKFCYVSKGSCCPWMGDCDCQCMCEFINEIREDERKFGAKIEVQGQHIDDSPPWWNGNIAIDFSTDEWEYVLNGLSALLDNAFVWGWADTDIEADIRNIIDRIEKSLGQAGVDSE